MGVKDSTAFVKASVVHTTKSLAQTRGHLLSQQHPSDGSKPVAGVDVSIWLHRALQRNEVVDQLFMEPRVPVSAAVDVVKEITSLLKVKGFRVVLVFDGKRFPPKAGTNTKRYEHLAEEHEKLLAMYVDPSTLIESIRKQQKSAAQIRGDVLFEVVNSLTTDDDVFVCCAPFEADHQLHALFRQGIIDVAVTEDSDVLFQGTRYVINKLSSGGGHVLVDFGLLASHFKRAFESLQPITPRAIAFFSCMLGTDYCDRDKGHGVRAALTKMKEYVKLETEAVKESYILRYSNLLKGDGNQPRLFQVALQCWEHSPAFVVVPHETGIRARDCFFGDNEFTVELRSMSDCGVFGAGQLGSDQLSFWIGTHEDANQNMRLDFIPMAELQSTNYKEYFLLHRWPRTEMPLEPVPPQYYAHEGRVAVEVFPGSIIDFNLRPPTSLSDAQLLFWLGARGIENNLVERNEILEKVEDVRRLAPEVLPKFLLRGGGGYVAFEVMRPRAGVTEVDWKTGDDMLAAVRSSGIPLIDDEYFTTIFGKRNNNRRRVLKHLQGGSVELQSIKTSTDLATDMIDEGSFFVFTGMVTASQKLSKTYLVRLVFFFQQEHDNDNGRFFFHPYSRCGCPNGVDVCAHQATLLTVLFVIQKMEDWEFEDLVAYFPDSIGRIVNLPIPVSYFYPPILSKTRKDELRRRRNILKRVGVIDEGDSNSNSEDNGGSEGSDDDSVQDDDEDITERVLALANPSAGDGAVVDVSTEEVIAVMAEVSNWIELLITTEDETGRPNKMAVEEINAEAIRVAQPNSDRRAEALQLAMLQRYYSYTDSDDSGTEGEENEKSVLDLYIHINQERIQARLDELKEEGIEPDYSIQRSNHYNTTTK